MNTQTHVLLAITVVGCAVQALANREDQTIEAGEQGELTELTMVSLIVVGALLPDISLFVMFGYAQLTGVPNEIIWSEMYYSDFWQNLGGITNSAPIFLSTALLAWYAINKQRSAKELLSKSGVSTAATHIKSNWGFGFLAVSLAALLHVAMDLPLHHDDGHPHFWPFSDWIFASPVSYWDSTHYAKFWVPIECLLGLTLSVLLWKKAKQWWTRGLVILLGSSYPIFAVVYFSFSPGS